MPKHAAKDQKSLFDEEVPETPPSPPHERIGSDRLQTYPTAETPSSPPESLAGQTVWVVDAHSLIHQVFHAMPEMTSPSGQPVNAVYGFTRDLFYLLESKQPDFLFCAFDLPGKTFRHELYEQYKAGRPDMHEDLVPQIDFVHRMVEALGIPLLAHEGFEADDVVATVARLTDELGGRCFIVSGDKDCRQLITERVKLYNIRKNEVFDREVLRQEWGVAPNQVVDYQALVGDSTDNVPGVPLDRPQGGPRPAGEIRHAGEHSRARGRGQRRGQEGEPQEVSRAGPAEPPAGAARRPRAAGDLLEIGPAAMGGDHARARRLFEEFGFRRLAERLPTYSARLRVPAADGTRQCAGPIKPVYSTIDTPEALAALVREMRRQKQISVDTETTHIWPRWAELVGISLSWNEQRGLVSAAPRAAGRAAARSPSDARRLAAGPGRPGDRQARPEPEIRSHRAPRRRHRTGRRALRHDGRQLSAWTPASGTTTSTTWPSVPPPRRPSRSKS